MGPRLGEWITRELPATAVDREAVPFGAAAHDTGKATQPEELSGPGPKHEEADRQFLLARGVASPARVAGPSDREEW